MLCVQNTSQPAPSNATAGDALPTAAGPTVIGVASVPVRSSRAARIVGLLSAEVARSSHVSRCWPLPNASAGAVALDTPAGEIVAIEPATTTSAGVKRTAITLELPVCQTSW